MKAIVGLLLPLALVSFTVSDEPQKVVTSDFHVECEGVPGMLDGKYTSYWQNGKKKAEGQMESNMRIGEWNLWDSTGRLVMTRNYTDGWNWTLKFPKRGVQRNNTGCVRIADGGYREFVWQKDSIACTARMWRYIPRDDRNPMFMKRELIDSLVQIGLRSEISRPAKDDEFTLLYTRDEFREQLARCDSNYIVEGYRIKDDWFYDYPAQTGLWEIVAICPVLKSKDGKTSIDLGWFYFPPLKPTLNNFRYLPRHRSAYPESMADQFSMRCFRSEIYKTTNVKNQMLDEMYSGPALTLQQRYWEFYPYETEHGEWMKYYNPQ